ncbi:DsrE family protein [Streptomyces anulatus]|uniref:hypothetical protein n=1 Tax=Streptomyces anulatus TaxID=1892 RepID=UPI002E33B7C5|nr:hypothetical protein [Streptomyces anulatus]
MNSHLLIETRGPWGGGRECASFVRDAAALAGGGHPTRLFLLQEGVLGALPGVLPELTDFLETGGQLLVDRYSYRQRGLKDQQLVEGGRLVDMDEIAGNVLDATVKVVWH